MGALKKSWRYVVLTKRCQDVTETMAVVIKKLQILLWPSSLIIRQNVNMAASAILHCGLTSAVT